MLSQDTCSATGVPDFADLVTEKLDERPAASRILVVRLGSMGDVIRTRFALPGLRALYPDAAIDWLVEDRSVAGLAGVAGVDEIVRVPRGALSGARLGSGLRLAHETVRGLRERGYDLAVDFHSISKSALLAWAAGIPMRVGYDRGFARERADVWLTHRATLRRRHVSRWERNAALVEYLGGRCACAPPPVVLPADDEPAVASVGAALPDSFAVIHPGTSPSTLYKRWEPERFGAVAKRLRDGAGVSSVVSWGPVPGERECAEAVVAASAGAAKLAPPTASIEVLLWMLSRARLFVGSDSGPVHLAALVGTPLAVLFGPTDPVENAPFPGVPSRVIRRDVGCNPCREGCPARACMAAIEPEAVARAALELLAG